MSLAPAGVERNIRNAVVVPVRCWPEFCVNQRVNLTGKSYAPIVATLSRDTVLLYSLLCYLRMQRLEIQE
jgi:hypothetical protein